MAEIGFHGIDIGLVDPGDDLIGRIADADIELRDDDVVVITSKVVSTAENRLIDANSVEVDARSERVADVTGLDPREVAVIYEESDVLGAIPIAEIGKDILIEHSVDPEAAADAIERMPSMLITDRDGHLCTNAGVDWSNAPEGMMTVLPQDPDASARRIREGLANRTGANPAVVLADSELLGPGSMDLATGCSGIQAIDSNFGRPDLYGEPKIGGLDLIADEIAAGAALLFGQADERTPVVVVRGLDYDDGEGVPNAGGLVRRGLRKTIQMTARLKAREWI
ncbi:MAG: coenzyme F420-0:L-glutamate ligase [Halococcoides sp.]